MSTESFRGRSTFEPFPNNPHQDGPDTESVVRASIVRMRRTGAPDEADAIVAVRQDSWDVTAANGTARQRLNEASARVQAVASVHAALYHTDEVRSVPFGEHLRALCARIAASAGLAERGIELVVSAEEASIATEKAEALGLIVNELVTNSLKHAFAEESAPGTARVTVSLERENDGLVPSVADNGGRARSNDVSENEDANEASSHDKLGGRLGLASWRRSRGRSERGSSSLMTVGGARGSRSVSRRETSMPWVTASGSLRARPETPRRRGDEAVSSIREATCR